MRAKELLETAVFAGLNPSCRKSTADGCLFHPWPAVLPGIIALMWSWMKRFQRSPVAASATPAIPRYPPFLQGLPAAPVAQVLATQLALLERLQQTLGFPAPEFDRLVQPALARYAGWVHLLPASEAHHHRGGGGLWRHGLEVALLAVQTAQGRIFGYGEPPARRRELEQRWRLAALLAGLCHDLGKPVTDLAVTSDQGMTWNPWLEPLSDWLQHAGVSRYFLRWRQGRYGQHEVATLAVVHRVLPSSCLAWLAEIDSGLVPALFATLAGMGDSTNPLVELLVAADRDSVERDLRTWREQTGQQALGIPVEQYLLDALRRLWRSGAWTVNVPGARVWVLAEGIHLVWRAAAGDMVELLARDRLAGIPRDPDTLADILLERRLAQPRELPSGRYRYWWIVPATLARNREGRQPVLYTLRLAPELLFEGVPPPPVAAQVLETEPETGAVETEAAVAGTGHDTAGGTVVPVPPSAPAEPVMTPALETTATTASPVAADFMTRLQAARLAGQLPFTVEDQDDGWQQLPYREATAWYTGQTGVSASMLAAALLQASPEGGAPPALLDRSRCGQHRACGCGRLHSRRP
ncbi:MAG: MobH family relaxase [Candidatus Competibacteraceae bacterium]